MVTWFVFVKSTIRFLQRAYFHLFITDYSLYLLRIYIYLHIAKIKIRRNIFYHIVLFVTFWCMVRSHEMVLKNYLQRSVHFLLLYYIQSRDSSRALETDDLIFKSAKIVCHKNSSSIPMVLSRKLLITVWNCSKISFLI